MLTLLKIQQSILPQGCFKTTLILPFFLLASLHKGVVYWSKNAFFKLCAKIHSFLNKINTFQPKNTYYWLFLLNFSHRHLRKIDWTLARTACPSGGSNCVSGHCKIMVPHAVPNQKSKQKHSFSWHSHLLSLKIDTHGSNLLSHF